MRERYTLFRGDAGTGLRTLPAASAHGCITSPPYFGLRSYLEEADPAKAQELGAEATPEEYVAALVAVFREVRRVLRPEASLWIVIGDSRARNDGGGYHLDGQGYSWGSQGARRRCNRKLPAIPAGNLIGIPWRLALAMQADGWILRSEVVWSKRNAMPDSARNRCTTAHELIFQFTTQATGYYWDRWVAAGRPDLADTMPWQSGRNQRTVWDIVVKPGAGEHPAVFPLEIHRRALELTTSRKGVCPACGAPWERQITSRRLLDGEPADHLPPLRNNDKGAPSTAQGFGHNRASTEIRADGWAPTCACAAGAPVPATLLDPFTGSGTTGLAALAAGRAFWGSELSAPFAAAAETALRHAALRAPAARGFPSGAVQATLFAERM